MEVFGGVNGEGDKVMPWLVGVICVGAGDIPLEERASFMQSVAPVPH